MENNLINYTDIAKIVAIAEDFKEHYGNTSKPVYNIDNENFVFLLAVLEKFMLDYNNRLENGNE